MLYEDHRKAHELRTQGLSYTGSAACPTNISGDCYLVKTMVGHISGEYAFLRAEGANYPVQDNKLSGTRDRDSLADALSCLFY